MIGLFSKTSWHGNLQHGWPFCIDGWVNFLHGVNLSCGWPFWTDQWVLTTIQSIGCFWFHGLICCVGHFFALLSGSLPPCKSIDYVSDLFALISGSPPPYNLISCVCCVESFCGWLFTLITMSPVLFISIGCVCCVGSIYCVVDCVDRHHPPVNDTNRKCPHHQPKKCKRYPTKCPQNWPRGPK